MLQRRLLTLMEQFFKVEYYISFHQKLKKDQNQPTSMQDLLLKLTRSRSLRKQRVGIHAISFVYYIGLDTNILRYHLFYLLSAGSSHNWNSLFLGASTVAKVISDKYGISREEMLLDKNDEKDNRLASVGVRMALAETEIVSETKSFLENNGVCLDAFDSQDKKAERSKTVILAKNLPSGTSVNDLRDLFIKHGVINRIVLPPSGITGTVVDTFAKSSGVVSNLYDLLCIN